MKLENTLSIVIVEDDLELRDHLMKGLSYFGFDLRGVGDGAELNAALAERPAHIILLDLGLPKEGGLEIAARMRDNPTLGIIILTGRSMTEERILGLESGADYYFVKPVEIAELAAAIKNLGRRLAPPVGTPWSFSAQTSSLQTPNGVTVSLTAQECILLELLFAHLGQNVSRQQIFAALGQPDEISSNARIEVLISRLRTKVQKADPGTTLPLRARHNMGYILLAGDGA
ncbi:protein petR [Geomonas silvestris]|uniref:Protein petR n=1 Tax=Geomonas silvestris TaxID=2740184 RepID=A0A6V8MGF7_9BACT|nr:response regulator transcription factor [Geomonas silvestris]GFO59004.1 protein petR [Geomonas silvestris]